MALTAAQFIALKNRIRAEMKRRKYCGSLESYGGTSYDFTTTPTAGGQIKTEHGQKVIDLALAVTDVTGLAKVVRGDLLPNALDNLGSTLSGWETTGVENSWWNDCRGMCTGLCYASCFTGCKGCTSCTNYCGGGCTYSCWNGCDYGCRTGCDGCTGGEAEWYD